MWNSSAFQGEPRIAQESVEIETLGHIYICIYIYIWGGKLRDSGSWGGGYIWGDKLRDLHLAFWIYHFQYCSFIAFCHSCVLCHSIVMCYCNIYFASDVLVPHFPFDMSSCFCHFECHVVLSFFCRVPCHFPLSLSSVMLFCPVFAIFVWRMHLAFCSCHLQSCLAQDIFWHGRGRTCVR